MTAKIDNLISDFPCCVCMGFCLEDSYCILCDVCKNWFHRECVNLSHKKFNVLSNDDSEFTCTICIHKKHCEICNSAPSESENFLYCVTCLKHFCDDCNPCLSDQIDIFRNTDRPFYCLSCSELYPCKVCTKHCYHDSVRQPFINCSSCKSRVHFKCSKLTKSQFNKIVTSNNPIYLCAVCLSENVPFSNVSNKALKNIVQVPISITNPVPILTSNCTLCTVCDTDCKHCVICPNNIFLIINK